VPRGWRIALVALVIAYACAGAAGAIARDRAMAATSEDTALFEHVLWSTLHGRLAHNLTLDSCHFGDHCAFLLLALVPFYWLVPRTETLLVLQSLALASCIVPAFLLARHWLRDEAAGLMAAAAVACHPAIASQLVNQVHAPQFGLPALVWAVWLLERRRFVPFMIAAALACFGKENVTLAVFMFGTVALVQRRGWRWVLGPALLSAGVMVVFIFIVAPSISGEAYRSVDYFEMDGPGGLAQVARRIVSGRRLMYLGQCLLFAGALLPLLGPVSLLAVPELAINMAVKSDVFSVMHYHFSMTVGIGLALGAVQGAARLRLPVRWTAAALAVLALLGNLTWLSARPFRAPRWHAAMEAAASLVPDDPNVSVLAPHEMMSALCRRHRIWYIDSRCLRGKDVTTLDVIVLNLNGVAPNANRQVGRIMREGRGVKTHRQAFGVDGVFVFVKRSMPRLAGEVSP